MSEVGEGQAGPSAFDWGPAINVIRTSGAPSLAAQAVEALWAKDAALRASEAALAEAHRALTVAKDKAARQVCVEPGCGEIARPYCPRHRGDWNCDARAEATKAVRSCGFCGAAEPEHRACPSCGTDYPAIRAPQPPEPEKEQDMNLITPRFLRNRARTWRAKAAALVPAREADELIIEARAFDNLADAAEGKAPSTIPVLAPSSPPPPSEEPPR